MKKLLEGTYSDNEGVTVERFAEMRFHQISLRGPETISPAVQ